MIALLTGTVVEKGLNAAVIDVGGVGYSLFMTTTSLAVLPAEGDTVTLHTHLHVREDALSLFGFENEREKELFEMLIGVSGVGPKVALAALSSLTPDALSQAIGRGDSASIARTPGIGKKTAERMIVELKDRLGALDSNAGAGAAVSDAYAEARDALEGMGFTQGEASDALADFEDESETAEALVKHALRRLGG